MISNDNFSLPVTGEIYLKDKQNLLHKLSLPVNADQFLDNLLLSASGTFQYSQANEPEPTYVGTGDAVMAGLGIRYKINGGSEQVHWGDSVQNDNYIKQGEIVNLTDLVISTNFTFSENNPFTFQITGYKTKKFTSNTTYQGNQTGYSPTFTIKTLDDFTTYPICSLNWLGDAFIRGVEANLVIEQENNQNKATLKNIRLFTAAASSAYNNWLNRNLLTKITLNIHSVTNTVTTVIDLTELENKIASLEERITLLENT